MTKLNKAKRENSLLAKKKKFYRIGYLCCAILRQGKALRATALALHLKRGLKSKYFEQNA
jgi:hypothetical protein